MSRETMTLCLAALEKTTIPTVDITGGAPELNPDFRWLVAECRARGRHVIDRCNLTVLELPSQPDLAAFLADQQGFAQLKQNGDVILHGGFAGAAWTF